MTKKRKIKTDPAVEKIFQKHGYQDYKWIDPKKIVVSQWVRSDNTVFPSKSGQTTPRK